METEQKQKIAGAILDFARDNGWVKDGETGVNKVSAFAKVNAMYVSRIMSQDFTYKDSKSGLMKDIKDHWFEELAKAIGYQIEKTDWPHVDTPQYRRMVSELRESLKTSANRVLICESGAGKTYTVDRFQKDNAGRVFVVTCSSSDNQSELREKILDAIGAKADSKKPKRINTIIQVSLYARGRRDGDKPMLIIDEAENLKINTMKLFKDLYDSMKWECAVVLIGTSQLIRKMDKLKAKDADGIPQFYRRYKAGIRYMAPIDKREDFDLFLEGKGYSAELKKEIRATCDNYGELYDYIVPAAKEAELMGKPLTAQFFRMKHGLFK